MRGMDTTEFGEASEIDNITLDKIRNEYLKSAFIVPFIFFVIAMVVTVLWFIVDFDYPMFMVFPLAICITSVPFTGIRCALSLIIFFKIKNRNFRWYSGRIVKMEWDCFGSAGGRRNHLFYLIDGKYLCTLITSPLYLTGTPVYLLYLPGTLEWIHLDGTVVKIKE